MATTYRYVTQALQDFDEVEGTILVMGYRGANVAKTHFVENDHDMFEVPYEDILSILKTPEVVYISRKIQHVFPGHVNVYEL